MVAGCILRSWLLLSVTGIMDLDAHTIVHKTLFIEQHKLPEKINKALEDLFATHNITVNDIGNQSFCEKLKAAGFTLIKSGRYENTVAAFPEHIGPFILKAEGRANKLKHNHCDNIMRIVIADSINHYVQKHGILTVRSPQKYLFRMPGAEEELCDKNYIVMAEKIAIDASKTIAHVTAEKLREFVAVVLESRLCDIKFYDRDQLCDSNTVFDHNGNIVILDTQPIIEISMRYFYEDFTRRGFVPVPRESIIAHTLLEKKDTNCQAQGRFIFECLYMVYCGLFPLFSTFENNTVCASIILAAIQTCQNSIEQRASEKIYCLDQQVLAYKFRQHNALPFAECVAKNLAR